MKFWARPNKPKWAGDDFIPAFHFFQENEVGNLVSLCGIVVRDKKYKVASGSSLPREACKICRKARE